MDSVIHVGVLVLEWLFFLGLIGSAVVVVWSFVEDMATIFTKDGPVAPELPAEQHVAQAGEPAAKTA